MHQDELPEYGNDFCGDLTKEQIAKELCSMGVSLDYNEPATYEKLCRVNEDKLRLCFNSIMWTNNLVDISRVKGSELSIKNVDNIEDIELKVKELSPNESVYIIAVGNIGIEGIEYLKMFLEKKGINCIIVRQMPEIKELKKL